MDFITTCMQPPKKIGQLIRLKKFEQQMVHSFELNRDL